MCFHPEIFPDYFDASEWSEPVQIMKRTSVNYPTNPHCLLFWSLHSYHKFLALFKIPSDLPKSGLLEGTLYYSFISLNKVNSKFLLQFYTITD